MASTDKEFFIGWQAKAPPATGRFLRRASLALMGVTASLAAVFAFSQTTIHTAVIEFGNIRTFEGMVLAEPLPLLLLAEPEESSGQSVFLLTTPLKNGFPQERADELEMSLVSLEGTLLYDDDNAMIEVLPESISVKTTESDPSLGPMMVSLGQQTLEGEIVDSKCWLGMMNPGSLKPHRACAINCISGGVPPLLLLRHEDGTTTGIVMTGEKGEAINKEVIDFVAEPISVSGELSQVGELLLLKTRVDSIKRL